MDYLSGLTNYITGQDQLESSTSVDSLLLRLESVVRPHEKEQTVEDLAQAVQGRPDVSNSVTGSCELQTLV